jgi:hypothetical protein
MKIELKSKGKTLAVLTGAMADIVDKAITQALMVIAKEEAGKKTIVKKQIGDDFISIQIEKRNWVDSKLPKGFSYSETILLIFKEMKDKGIARKQERIDYMKKRIIELRQQAQPQNSREKAAA